MHIKSKQVGFVVYGLGWFILWVGLLFWFPPTPESSLTQKRKIALLNKDLLGVFVWKLFGKYLQSRETNAAEQKRLSFWDSY